MNGSPRVVAPAALDYVAMIGILLVISAAGYIQGVMVGLLAATILFAVNYSRVHVVSQALSGAQQHSNVERPLNQQKILRTLGGRIHILKLQGFIFFGSANNLLNDIRHRLQNIELEPLEFVVLDFSRVQGLDSSAVLALRKLLQQAEPFNFTLIFCSASPEIRAQIASAGFPIVSEGRFVIHTDRDHALEWCENRLLEELTGAEAHHATLEEQVKVYWPQDGEKFAGMLPYLERQEIPEKEYLMLQGDPAEELFFIEHGRVTISWNCKMARRRGCAR